MEHPINYWNNLLAQVEKRCANRYEMAKALGVNTSMVSMLLSGERRPSFAVMVRAFDFVEQQSISPSAS